MAKIFKSGLAGLLMVMYLVFAVTGAFAFSIIYILVSGEEVYSGAQSVKEPAGSGSAAAPLASQPRDHFINHTISWLADENTAAGLGEKYAPFVPQSSIFPTLALGPASESENRYRVLLSRVNNSPVQFIKNFIPPNLRI